MKVLVIGAGKSGESAAEMLRQTGALVDVIGGHYDFVVQSPGVPVFSELDMAFRYARFDKVVAVTGTNGKTSTVTMIHNALQLAGIPSTLCGNVGLPVSAVVGQGGVCVVEVSSFQMEVPPRYFKPDISVILNITPDHLDRHGSMEEYARCKQRIRGKVHFENLSNVDAVRAVCDELGVASEIVERAIRQYYGQPQPHRIELVAEYDGIKFVNDSKATNIASTIYACEKFKEPIHLIVGGVAKGQDFTDFRAMLPSHVKKVFVIGSTEIEGVRCTDLCDAAEQAVQAFNDQERGGGRTVRRVGGKCRGVVLLSPACASFDMFRNYEHRGEVFRDAVSLLLQT